MVWLPLAFASTSAKAIQPNVLLIVTDDQGFGDLGHHGNAQIRTPRLDALARESVGFRSFTVSPVCSLTRASLMTGRYSYRTGVVDTFRGRSIMRGEEVTIAEILAKAGYRTGIFGKWHLGDNAPFRAIDQGFGEALVHRGGGIGQGFEPPGGGSYFDPILMRNGAEERSKGYCSDLFADAAIRFVEADRSRPFFAYLAFNAPHDPLEVPDKDRKGYEDIKDEDTAKVYSMVSNVDANIGRVLDRLDQLGLSRDTIVVFLTDNGPQQVRFNAGLLGRKGSVHDGGIRVPCFVRWPGTLDPGRMVEPIAGSIDIAPTILAACGIAKPANVAFDGRDLMPLLRGQAAEWPDRTIVSQWHRGDVPELGRAFAIRNERFKLVQPIGVEPIPLPLNPRLELFDMRADPFESHDVADANPEVVASLLASYRAWFADVVRPSAPIRIHLGSPVEDSCTLTRQDWRGDATAWEPGALGGWDVDVIRAGVYDLTLRFAVGPAGVARFELGDVKGQVEVGPKSSSCRFEGVKFPQGPGRIRASVERAGAEVGVYHLVVHRKGDMP